MKTILNSFQAWQRKHLTAIPRMSLGLVSVAVLLLLVCDLVFGLFPSEAQTRKKIHLQVANNLAVQTAALLQERNWRALEQSLQMLQQRNPDFSSLGVRRVDGSLLVQTAAHPQQWPDVNRPLGHDITVSLIANGQPWGQLEVARSHDLLADLAGDFWAGPARMLLLFSAMAGLLYFLYLRRMLEHLDPAAAVPDRVRSAFDTLIEGVMVVDTQGRILLVNKVFESLRSGDDETPLIGQRAHALRWLRPADEGVSVAPWMEAMRHSQTSRGLAFVVRDARSLQVQAHVVLNCSPLTDEQGSLRGCLVSVDDVSELEASHRQLLDVLADLAASKHELELKNQELAQLANQDMLSGCLNRRSFFDLGAGLFKRAQHDGVPLVCVMADIDHFKKINDTWGHAVGDQAIRRFAELLRQHIRPGDLLGRYGGEEFVVLILGASVDRCQALAEQLRASVAANNGVGLEPGAQLKMSASFGISALLPGAARDADTEPAADLAGLIDLADRAMYVAKRDGRNRVALHASAQPASSRPDRAVTPKTAAASAKPAAQESLA